MAFLERQFPIICGLLLVGISLSPGIHAATSACARNPCIHGSCVDSGNGQYSCNCYPGYTDNNCFTDIDDCQSSPCVHGQCLDGVNTYSCVCNPGYAGTQCNTDTNECVPNPCHHGRCFAGTNGFTCYCDFGYTGMICDTMTEVAIGPTCYYCHYAVYDPVDCRETDRCSRDESCSVLELPVTGARYKVGCMSNRMCMTLLAVYGVRPCTQCCRGNLCNGNCTTTTPTISPASDIAEADVVKLNERFLASPLRCQDDASCQQLVSALKAAHHNVCTMPSLKHMCNQTCGVCHSTGNTGSTGSTTHHWSTVTTPASTPLVTSPVPPACQDDTTCQQLVTTFQAAHKDICTVPKMKYLCNNTCGLCSSIGPTVSTHTWSTAAAATTTTTMTSPANGACATGPCLHGACTNTAGGYHCNCHSGYLGTNCKTRDPCTMQPCRHGQCSSTSSGGFRCHCDPGYTGVLCDTATSACARNPCIHGACVDSGNGQYHCNCDPGYTDPNCFTDINDCQPSPCVHGQCLDGVNTYTCVCTPGYTGTQCNTVINECMPNPCHHGKCINWTNGFICQCDMAYTGMTCDTKIHTRDCKDIKDLGMTSKDNVFTVKDATNSDLDIKCDMTTDGGGWTVLLYRDSNSVNFDHRDSTDYAVGFGDIHGDYWIGLENMHSLTSDGRQYELRIEIYDAGGQMYYEIYDDFRVDGRHEFRLHVGAGRGTAGDSLSNHTGYWFTTWDDHRDTDSGVNCAVYLHAGWWFHHCYDSCLTCPYLQPGTYNCASMSWNGLSYCVALSKAVMMVRSM